MISTNWTNVFHGFSMENPDGWTDENHQVPWIFHGFSPRFPRHVPASTALAICSFNWASSGGTACGGPACLGHRHRLWPGMKKKGKCYDECGISIVFIGFPSWNLWLMVFKDRSYGLGSIPIPFLGDENYEHPWSHHHLLWVLYGCYKPFPSGRCIVGLPTVMIWQWSWNHGCYIKRYVIHDLMLYDAIWWFMMVYDAIYDGMWWCGMGDI